MDIKQITYFAEVANHKSYSYAAKKLGVSQPALSASMKKLEQEFGIKLFYYTSKELMLTEMGKEFLANTRRILQDYNALVMSMEDITTKNIGRIKVGVPLMVGNYFGQVFSDFKNKYPKIEFQIVEDGAQSIADMVAAGDLDCAFVVSPISQTQFDIHDEIKDRYVIAVSFDNPVSANDSVDFSALRNEPFVCFNERYSAHRSFMQNCEDARFDPKIVAYSSQWDFMLALVENNQAICMLPRPVVENYPNKRIKYLEINKGVSEWVICLITKKEQYLPKSTRLFIEHVKKFNNH